MVESRDTRQTTLPFDENIKVLVVDDDRDTREILAIHFASHGYNIVTAQNGIEALDTINFNGDIDVVLLDVFIPSMGGMEVLTEINRQPHPPSVIVLTGLADKEIAQDALRLGAFDYILKPFNLIQVESSVVACVAHREYVRQSWWKRMALRPAS